ncbi:MAG: hypothetical protein MJE66_01335 [Proteobacteria bacterium]|nr:hypothetical protein [Pseudomonadota bacterium]
MKRARRAVGALVPLLLMSAMPSAAATITRLDIRVSSFAENKDGEDRDEFLGGDIQSQFRSTTAEQGTYQPPGPDVPGHGTAHAELDVILGANEIRFDSLAQARALFLGDISDFPIETVKAGAGVHVEIDFTLAQDADYEILRSMGGTNRDFFELTLSGGGFGDIVRYDNSDDLYSPHVAVGFGCLWPDHDPAASLCPELRDTLLAGDYTLVYRTSASDWDYPFASSCEVGCGGTLLGTGGIMLTPVPEPSAGLLVIVGLTGLALRRGSAPQRR